MGKDKFEPRKPRALKPLSAEDSGDSSDESETVDTPVVNPADEDSAITKNLNDQNTTEDEYSAKFSQIFEALDDTKCHEDRNRLYNSLIKLFQTRYLTEEYLEKNKSNLERAIETGLKQYGDFDEIGAAAILFSLSMITMGNSQFNEKLFEGLYTQISRHMIDPSAMPSNRTKCATTLGFGCFITNYGFELMDRVLNDLLLVALKPMGGDPPANQVKPMFTLRANCFKIFGFVATLYEKSIDVMRPDMKDLIEALDSPSLEMRMACGEMLALIYEYCMEEEIEFELFKKPELIEKLTYLAKESTKSKSKKELRVQRQHFRQILRTIDPDDPENPESYGPETLKFGQEQLVIDSWKMKVYYDVFKSVLGPGINVHMMKNPIVRDVFELGPIIDPIVISKSAKEESKRKHNAYRKGREIRRTKDLGGRRGRDVARELVHERDLGVDL